MVEQVGEHQGISEQFSQQEIDDFNRVYFQDKNTHDWAFFILQKSGDGQVLCFRLADKISASKKDDNFADDDMASIYFCYSDPCATPDIAGWTARLYLTMLIHLWWVANDWRIFCQTMYNRHCFIIAVRSSEVK